MKLVLASRVVKIPKTVKVAVKARKVTVEGPRGVLHREFKFRNLDIKLVGKRSLRVDCWFGNRKELACVRTITSHIENMVVGVTKGFLYKLRFAYAHFPINVEVTRDSKVVEIRNFLGERRVRIIPLLEGVTGKKTDQVKDQLELEGNSIENVSDRKSVV